MHAPTDRYPHLALFDLDNTLLPIDSDHEWSRYLVRVGVLDEQTHTQANHIFFEQYQAGVLDIDAFLTFQLAPLAAHSQHQLGLWHADFMQQVIRPNLHPKALQLVQQHLDRGHLCALVTATNEFITAPIARAFGINHLIATRLEQRNGQYTGRPQGKPSFREGKVERTLHWLASLGHQWEHFPRSYFYTDSINDLPLLERVSDPIATNPDLQLSQLAARNGWKIVRLFE